MADFPRDTGLDGTSKLLSEGYLFGSNRFRRLGTDAFETRLMLRPALVVHGAEAAEMFYVPDRFTRRGALPPTTLRLLQDVGSVATLDGAAHRERKRLFLPLLDDDAVAGLTAAVIAEWRTRLPDWEAAPGITLHPEVQDILCRAVCRWAGAPLSEDEAPERTREFAAMIAGAGSVGPRAIWGMVLRRRTERWATAVVEDVRNGRRHPPEGSMLATLCATALATPTAVVEFLNVLRPTVAVARFITFAALALHQYPAAREDIGDDAFANEVRRFYPFFPFVAGRALTGFEWRGRRVAEGQWVLLDLYATNHDHRVWHDPGVFRPSRFRKWDGGPFTFIPQGGGDFATGHRCPGENIAIALIAAAVRLLATEVRYSVPPQDLSFSMATMPALPNSGFQLTNARPAAG